MPPIRVLVVVLVTTTAMLSGVGAEGAVSPSDKNTPVLQNAVELSFLDNVQGFLERLDGLLETVVDLLDTLQQLFGETEETGD